MSSKMTQAHKDAISKSLMEHTNTHLGKYCLIGGWKNNLPKCIDCNKQLSRADAKRCKKCMGLSMKDNRSPHWKGDAVGYGALHDWVVSRKGKAEKCEKCGSIKNVNWSNISMTYRRDLTDWMELCRFCHVKYDRQNGWGEATKKFPNIARKEVKNY